MLRRAVLLLGLAACGGAKSSPAPVSAVEPGPRGEIEQLDAQIEADLTRLGPDSSAQPMSGGTCDDVCTLAESICTAATRICDLAASFPDDAYAVDRCDARRTTCAEATDRCCGCEPKAITPAACDAP
jgi:hypothetical protein